MVRPEEAATTARYLPPDHHHIPPTEANATLARILNAIEEYVYTGEFLPDAGYQVIFAGPCREHFLGMSVEDARTAVWADYVHPDDVATFETAHDSAHVSGHLDVEYRLAGADGIVRWVRDRGRLRHERGRRLLDGSILDVTAMHDAREALRAAHARADHLARTDALTGVANRRSLPGLFARLDAVPVGVLCLDVDRFKLINDLYGHAVGDAALVELADRLRGTIGADDRVVRMGGEEFVVLMPGVGTNAELHDRAERIRWCVGGAPMMIGGHAFGVTVSIGAAYAPAGRDVEALLTAGDRALYVAKRAGRDRVHLASADRVEEELGDDDSDALRLASAMATVACAAEGMPKDHLIAVSLLAAGIARHLRATGPTVQRCRVAGLLHDVGKLHIPAVVLNKPGALDADEWLMIQRHPEHGERIVAAVPDLAPVAHIVRHHHERYDGAGYPDGLLGQAIPLEARIIAVADAFNTITTDRPYRRGAPMAAALAELERVAGSQLDPRVVASLRAVVG